MLRSNIKNILVLLSSTALASSLTEFDPNRFVIVEYLTNLSKQITGKESHLQFKLGKFDKLYEKDYVNTDFLDRILTDSKMTYLKLRIQSFASSGNTDEFKEKTKDLANLFKPHSKTLLLTHTKPGFDSDRIFSLISHFEHNQGNFMEVLLRRTSEDMNFLFADFHKDDVKQIFDILSEYLVSVGTEILKEKANRDDTLVTGYKNKLPAMFDEVHKLYVMLIKLSVSGTVFTDEEGVRIRFESLLSNLKVIESVLNVFSVLLSYDSTKLGIDYEYKIIDTFKLEEELIKAIKQKDAKIAEKNYGAFKTTLTELLTDKFFTDMANLAKPETLKNKFPFIFDRLAASLLNYVLVVSKYTDFPGLTVDYSSMLSESEKAVINAGKSSEDVQEQVRAVYPLFSIFNDIIKIDTPATVDKPKRIQRSDKFNYLEALKITDTSALVYVIEQDFMLSPFSKYFNSLDADKETDQNIKNLIEVVKKTLPGELQDLKKMVTAHELNSGMVNMLNELAFSFNQFVTSDNEKKHLQNLFTNAFAIFNELKLATVSNDNKFSQDEFDKIYKEASKNESKNKIHAAKTAFAAAFELVYNVFITEANKLQFVTDIQIKAYESFIVDLWILNDIVYMVSNTIPRVEKKSYYYFLSTTSEKISFECMTPVTTTFNDMIEKFGVSIHQIKVKPLKDNAYKTKAITLEEMIANLRKLFNKSSEITEKGGFLHKQYEKISIDRSIELHQRHSDLVLDEMKAFQIELNAIETSNQYENITNPEHKENMKAIYKNKKLLESILKNTNRLLFDLDIIGVLQSSIDEKLKNDDLKKSIDPDMLNRYMLYKNSLEKRKNTLLLAKKSENDAYYSTLTQITLNDDDHINAVEIESMSYSMWIAIREKQLKGILAEVADKKSKMENILKSGKPEEIVTEIQHQLMKLKNALNLYDNFSQIIQNFKNSFDKFVTANPTIENKDQLKKEFDQIKAEMKTEESTGTVSEARKLVKEHDVKEKEYTRYKNPLFEDKIKFNKKLEALVKYITENYEKIYNVQFNVTDKFNDIKKSIQTPTKSDSTDSSTVLKAFVIVLCLFNMMLGAILLHKYYLKEEIIEEPDSEQE